MSQERAQNTKKSIFTVFGRWTGGWNLLYKAIQNVHHQLILFSEVAGAHLKSVKFLLVYLLLCRHAN